MAPPIAATGADASGSGRTPDHAPRRAGTGDGHLSRPGLAQPHNARTRHQARNRCTAGNFAAAHGRARAPARRGRAPGVLIQRRNRIGLSHQLAAEASSVNPHSGSGKRSRFSHVAPPITTTPLPSLPVETIAGHDNDDAIDLLLAARLGLAQ